MSINIREAIMQLNAYECGIRVWGSLQYQVYRREDPYGSDVLLVDTLDEAVEMAPTMRLTHSMKQQSGHSGVDLSGYGIAAFPH